LICCDVRVPCKAATMHADALRRVASCHVISRLRQDAVNKLQRLLASMCRPAAMSKAGSDLTVYCRHTEPPLVRCGRHWSSSRRARSLHNRCSARTSWVHAEVGPCEHHTHARAPARAQILEAKTRKLEQLLRLKDAKIAALEARLHAAQPA